MENMDVYKCMVKQKNKVESQLNNSMITIQYVFTYLCLYCAPVSLALL